MKKHLALIGAIIFSMSLTMCEKDDGVDGALLSYYIKDQLKKTDVIKDYSLYYYDTLMPIEITFNDSIMEGVNYDYEGEKLLIRAVFDKIELINGDIEYNYKLSNNNDTLKILLEKSDASFKASIYFKWEVFQNDTWVPYENYSTYNSVQCIDYPSEIINSFVEEFSIEDSSSVSVFTAPSILFKYNIGEEYKLADLGINVIPQVEACGIKDETGNEISIQEVWEESKKELTLQLEEPLKKNSKYTVYVNNNFKLKKDSETNIKMLQEKSFEITKMSMVVFWTKDEFTDDIIDDGNIEYSYPIKNQYNFLPQEYNKGFIKLKMDQVDITGNPYNTSIDYEVRFIDIANPDTVEYPVDFDFSEKYFSYNITNKLNNSTIYKIELVKNISGDPSIIYQYYFKTSLYDTFKDKINDLFISSGYRSSVETAVYEVGNSIFGDELFDTFEIHGLIQFDIDLANNEWYQENNLLYLYEGMFETTLRLENRNAEIYGAPPVHAMYIRQIGANIQLMDTDIQNQTANWAGYATAGGFVSCLQKVTYDDISDLRAQSNDLVGNNYEWYADYGEWYSYLSTLSVPPYYEGVLDYNIKYVIPGNITTSEIGLKISW